jgi:hypothetical protein
MNLESTLRALDAGSPIAATHWSPEQLHTFVESGASSLTTVELSEAQKDARLKQVTEWIQFASGESASNAAYMDTTTLYTALAYASDHSAGFEYAVVTPASVFDLCTFVNGAILFDHIFCLENSHFDPSEMNQLLGNEPAIIALPIEQFDTISFRDELSGAGGLLRQFWYQTQSHMYDLRQSLNYKRSALYEEATEIRKSWKTIIDFDDHENLWFKGDRLMESFDSDGPRLLEQLVDISAHNVSTLVLRSFSEKTDAVEDYVQKAHELITESDHRSYFNMQVSDGLTLPYLANSFRLPYRRFHYRKAQEINKLLPTLAIINREYAAKQDLYLPPEVLRLPFFLSIVLSRISSARDFLPAVAELRWKAATFRAHRRELDAALREGKGGRILQNLQHAIRGDSDQIRAISPARSAASFSFSVLPLLLSPIHSVLVAALVALKAASEYKPEDIEKLRDRALKRQLWFLTDLRRDAEELTNAYPVINRIWRALDDEREFTSGLARIGELSQY